MNDPPPTELALPTPPEPPAGGRFQRQRRLGRGGMGEVWLAWDSLLHDHVAIKILHPHLRDDPVARRSLQREIHGLRHLHHPHLLHVFDLHESPDEILLAMEWVDGISLAAHLTSQPHGVLDADALLALLEPIADALDYAHAEGVLHRDLKPANILLTHDGSPKLADFGLARSMRESLVRTSGFASVAGTLPFLSPQALMGEDPSSADDLYALAATVFECLAGRTPFHTGAIDLQIREKPAPRLSEVRRQVAPEAPALPKAWDGVLAGALSKRPEARPASARELVARLRGAQDGAARPRLSTFSRPHIRRHSLWVAAGTIALAAVATGVWSTAQGHLNRPPRGVTADPGAPPTPAATAPAILPPPPAAARESDLPTPTGLVGSGANGLLGHLTLDGHTEAWPPHLVNVRGELYNGVDRDGHANGALHLSGSANLEIARPWGTPQPPEEFTVCFWFQPINSAAEVVTLVSRDRVGRKVSFSFTPRFSSFHVGTATATDSFVDIPPLELGRWYHLAIVSSPSEVRLYLDGVRAAALPLASPWQEGEIEQLLVGGSYISPPNALTGPIDDLRWYRRAGSDDFLRSLAMEPALRPAALPREPQRPAPASLPYSVTSGLYADGGDWDTAAQAEFGAGAEPADWLEVKALVEAHGAEVLDRFGLKPHQSFLVRRGGQSEFRPGRYYAGARQDGRVRISALIHDHAAGYTLALGSSAGQSLPILVRLPSDRLPPWNANLRPPWPEGWSFAGPPIDPDSNRWSVAQDQPWTLRRTFDVAPAQSALTLEGSVLVPNEPWDAGVTWRLLAAEAEASISVTIQRSAGQPGSLEFAVSPSNTPPRHFSLGAEELRAVITAGDGRVHVRLFSRTNGHERLQQTFICPALALGTIRQLEIVAHNEATQPILLRDLQARGH